MRLPRRLTVLLTAAGLLTGGAVAAPAAHAAPGDRELVDAWYVDFLGRDADEGSSYWVDRLGGQQPSDVLWSITHSEEYDAGTIEIYYQYVLERAPDPGARYWIDGINEQRFPREWALQNILASPEYLAGKDRAAVVNGYIDVLLDHPATSRQRAYWTQRLGEVGPLATVREIYYTPESVRLGIQSAYALLLERRASDAEISYWYDKQVENSVNVQVLIASTPEYRSLVTG